MRIRDITEASQINDLIAQVSRVIPSSLREYVHRTIREWRFLQTYEKRKSLGNPSDEEFENLTHGWNPDDYIGDHLNDLITLGSGPVYGAMTAVSKALTREVQVYFQNKYGDPLILQYKKKKVSVPVDKIRVSVWWHARQGQNYSGVFRAQNTDANGTGTLIEVVVDRDDWRSFVIQAFVDELSGEGSNYGEFAEYIMNTFAHEVAHLEQVINGQKNYTYSLIPDGKAGRNSSSIDGTKGEMTDKELVRYLGRPAEIDAMAVGAASQVINRLMRDYEIEARRHGYFTNWSLQDVPDETWNRDLQYMINEIPSKEYIHYIETINDQLANYPGREKYLKRVQHRFLKRYYSVLQSYMRPSTRHQDKPR
jgi:hypothetical protein